MIITIIIIISLHFHQVGALRMQSITRVRAYCLLSSLSAVVVVVVVVSRANKDNHQKSSRWFNSANHRLKRSTTTQVTTAMKDKRERKTNRCLDRDRFQTRMNNKWFPNINREDIYTSSRVVQRRCGSWRLNSRTF